MGFYVKLNKEAAGIPSH